MTENIYVVYDVRARQILPPLITSQNDVNPIREIERLVNNENTMFYTHPEDFQLIRVGRINLETGELDPEITVQTVTELNTLKRK